MYTIDKVDLSGYASVWNFAKEAPQSKPTTKYLLHFKLLLFIYTYIY